MRICGVILAIFYAGLMLFAVYKGNLKSASSALIVIGCLSGLLYTFLNIIWRKNFILIMILGMLNISAGCPVSCPLCN